jgi:hypothetical protein
MGQLSVLEAGLRSVARKSRNTERGFAGASWNARRVGDR